MARLFSKDYHEKSASWYFNHVVIPLENGDLEYWQSIDEKGYYHIHFVATPDKKEFFNTQLDVVYDPESQRIISHHCQECKDDESCRHYLSVLRYAYMNLRTDIFEQPAVETCDGTALRGKEKWLEVYSKAVLEIEGIYSPDTDKVRFYHDSYEPLNISLLMRIQAGIDIEGITEQEKQELVSQLDIFSETEQALFKFLNEHKAAYSSKTKYWSLYKKDFISALSFLQSLNGKVKVRETDEPLKFSSEPYPLSLRIEPAGKLNYRVYPIIIDELSAVYPGYPTWLFFRNVVRPVYLPLSN
ncbi:MAG: ATP-dependent helicase, partial [Candidatus Cloacimonetes bacterium]|nr:ATP-dependent helicase [Candidatus Cloacimonadota bacterium]